MAVLKSTAIASCAVVLALSCAPDGAQPADSTAHTDSAARMTLADSLDIRLLVPDTATRGARVPVAMTVRNTSGKTIDLYLHGREATLDVIVRGADGQVIWRRLADQNIRAILKIHPLGAGEALAVSAEWPSAESGEHTITGIVLTENPRLESKPRRLVVR